MGNKTKTELYKGALCRLIDDKSTPYIFIKDEEILENKVVLINQKTNRLFDWELQSKKYFIAEFDQDDQKRTMEIPVWVIFLEKNMVKFTKRTRKRALVSSTSGLWLVPLHCLEQCKISQKAE